MATKWSCNANEATCLRLAGAPAPCDGVFHPEFTYPIFGEAETIFGYQGLHIRLTMASGSLAPCLELDYKAKNATTTAKIDDVEGTLREYLPDDEDLVPPADMEARIQADQASFKPLGTLVTTYKRSIPKARGSQAKEREFAIFHATWDTPGFRAWHKRAQIFTLFFIEGASYIDDEEANWEFYTVFERTQTQTGEAWHFVGYTSLYRFWCWPDRTRLRLSQFVILPPYQGQRHGSELYKTVYAKALDDASICEMTVEDPSEAFDHLRDSCDLQFLAQQPDVASHLMMPIDRTWSRTARTKYKLAPRQWARVLEMLALLRLPDDAASQQAYRLQVKARIYGVNREVLEALPQEQRLEKLHETFEAVMDEYAEMTGADVPESLFVLPPPSRKRANSASDQGMQKTPRLV